MNDHLSTDHLVDFVHGELSPERDATAHAHLALCATCRDAYDLETTLSEALRAAAKADEREMPSLVNAAVWDRIRQARPGPMARLAGVLRPAFALPIAAAILIGGFFASPLAHPAANKTIDAAYYFAAHAAQAGATPLSERPNAPVLETSMISPGSSSFADSSVGFATASSADDVR